MHRYLTVKGQGSFTEKGEALPLEQTGALLKKGGTFIRTNWGTTEKGRHFH